MKDYDTCFRISSFEPIFQNLSQKTYRRRFRLHDVLVRRPFLLKKMIKYTVVRGRGCQLST